MEDYQVVRVVAKLRRELKAAKTSDEVWEVRERLKKLGYQSNHHPQVAELKAEAKERYDYFKKNLL